MTPSEKYTLDDIVKKVVSGELPMHRIEDYLDPRSAAEARRKAIESLTGTRLGAIGSSTLDYSAIVNKNAENVIGYAQIPLGIVGPLKVSGAHAKGSFYIPMSTTEGALIASVNRGIKAVTLSNGAKAMVLKNAMTRGPVFELESIEDVAEFLDWLDANKESVKNAAEETTSHGKMRDLMPFVVGNNVWLRFSFETGDAMGMNMVTIATEAACEHIERLFKKARLISVSGNMCSDKKVSFVNNLLGRGKTVLAEAVIKEKIVKEVLKTTPKDVHNTNLKKNLLGSARAGSTTYSGHVANMIAAVFAATGQDLAQVVESSSCYTWTELRGKDLYISVTMPSLEIGTIGGGSSLSTQREALSIMGVAGGGSPSGSNSLKFAEIISGVVLAGELNLLSAEFTREIGRSHKRLGRNMKK